MSLFILLSSSIYGPVMLNFLNSASMNLFLLPIISNNVTLLQTLKLKMGLVASNSGKSFRVGYSVC